MLVSLLKGSIFRTSKLFIYFIFIIIIIILAQMDKPIAERKPSKIFYFF